MGELRIEIEEITNMMLIMGQLHVETAVGLLMARQFRSLLNY